MYTIILVINIISALSMVAVILLQHGRGADMGASFGRGSQGSLVGITGSSNFLSKSTSVLAVVFFVTALALGIVSQSDESDDLLESLSQPQAESQVEEAPAQESQGDASEASEVPAAPSKDY